MSIWRVNLLGIPFAVHNESGRRVHLRSRQAWGLLASLLLEPQTRARGLLAVRFWPGGDERKSLGMALSSLRKEFGPEAVTACRDAVHIDRSLFVTDVEQTAAWEAMAARKRDPAASLASLLEAAQHVSGLFLAEYDLDKDPDNWVQGWQIKLEDRCVELLVSLCVALREAGQLAAASEWELRTASLFPYNAAATERAWRQLQDESRTPAGTDLHFPEQLARARIEFITLEERDSLARLSIFPGAFTETQAASICAVPRKKVSALYAEGFLARSGNTFRLPAEVRAAALPLLPLADLTDLQDAHARQVFITLKTTMEHPDWRPTPRMLPDFQMAAWWLVRQPPSVEGLDSIDCLRILVIAQDMAAAPLLLEWCLAAADAPILPPPELRRALFTASKLACDMRQFARSRRLLLRFVEIGGPDEPYTIAVQLCDLALVCHHAEETEEALQCVQEGRRLIYGTVNGRVDGGMLFLLAEIYSVIDSCQALEFSAEALALRRCADPRPEALAASLYQWSFLRLATPLPDTAYAAIEAALDEALLLFEVIGDRTGIADWLRASARLRAEQGLLGAATFLARAAISRYEELGAAPARAAALGVLGDILHRRGDLDGARRCYQEGLTIWRSVAHRRWTSHFEAALRTLETTRPTPSCQEAQFQ